MLGRFLTQTREFLADNEAIKNLILILNFLFRKVTVLLSFLMKMVTELLDFLLKRIFYVLCVIILLILGLYQSGMQPEFILHWLKVIRQFFS